MTITIAHNLQNFSDEFTLEIRNLNKDDPIVTLDNERFNNIIDLDVEHSKVIAFDAEQNIIWRPCGTFTLNIKVFAGMTVGQWINEIIAICKKKADPQHIATNPIWFQNCQTYGHMTCEYNNYDGVQLNCWGQIEMKMKE